MIGLCLIEWPRRVFARLAPIKRRNIFRSVELLILISLRVIQKLIFTSSKLFFDTLGETTLRRRVRTLALGNG